MLSYKLFNPPTSKEVYDTCVPFKVVFFVWELIWGKSLTLNLMRSGWSLVSILCESIHELVYHIRIHSDKTQLPYDFLLAIFEMQWLFLKSVKEHLMGRKDMAYSSP